MSKVSALYHIVFSTKHRMMTIGEEHKRELYAYLHGIIVRHKSQTLRINGIGNHVHLLVDLHPTVALATLTQALKQGSSNWMRGHPHFPLFQGWGAEYFAFTVSQTSSVDVIEYIKNQERHHLAAGYDYENEMKTFCCEYGLQWHPAAMT